ncbi:MAG: ABC transporter substrate-binding protein [Burkholderiaceae bacterium]
MISSRRTFLPSRRAAVVMVLGTVAAPLAAQQQAAPRKVRIAFLSASTSDPLTLRSQIEPLRQGLRELGWVEGQNLVIEFRWAEGKFERLPGMLDELIRLQPDVLMTTSPRPAMLAKDATRTIPIVAVAVDDPVQMGLVASLARPGANITGISAAFDGILEKRLQLLKEIVPAARRFAVLFNPNTLPRTQGLDEAALGWGKALGIEIQWFEARGPEDFNAAFAAMARERANGVAVLADPMIWIHRAKLGALCLEQRLPSIWGGAGYLDAGGLVSYQGDWPALFKRSASLVDKILKGQKPGDIPFEQGSKLELVVNLKGAKALGVTIPPSVLVSADEVIE